MVEFDKLLKTWALEIYKSPIGISSVITLSYFIFYTGYDKVKKQLVIQNLIDLVQIRKGWDWTLVEINKAISLSGLTTLLFAFLPTFEHQRNDLLWISMNMLLYHSSYSMYKFYGFDLRNIKPSIKQLSIAFGSFGQLALATGYYGYIPFSSLLLSTTTLGIAHFWTMEIDYKYKLQVRPYAYLPFPLAGLVLWFYYNDKTK